MDTTQRSGGELQRFIATLFELESELNWVKLGRHYCAEGGEDFFPPEQIEAIRDAGLRFAGDIEADLEEIVGAHTGRSLYVGAAVAELVPALFEALVLEREVVLHNLPGAETKELNRALAAVEARSGGSLPRVVTTPIEELEGWFQHVWMTSVLSDPEHFPALHNKVYERSGAKAAPGGDLGQDTQKARRLMRSVIELVRPPSLFTTSDEEASFLIEAAKRRGMRPVKPRAARLSAIVGDPVRLWRLF
ncbi:MAG: hypothetical protein WD226_03280 [Planctomycetota bacterium]